MTTLCWFEMGDKGILRPGVIKNTIEKIKVTQEKIKRAQDLQKSYVDQHRRTLEFKEGDHVFFKVTPNIGLIGLFKTKKLSPGYIGAFQIIIRVGEVAYQLELPHPLMMASDQRIYLKPH